jgi:hypothetical protein
MKFNIGVKNISRLWKWHSFGQLLRNVALSVAVNVVLMCWLCETELCATVSNTRPQEEEVDYTLQPFYLVKASPLRQVYQLSTVL